MIFLFGKSSQNQKHQTFNFSQLLILQNSIKNNRFSFQIHMNRKTGTVPRPAPRFTQQQLELEVYSEQPDPKYIIQKIQNEISCLQSEKNRLSAKFTQLSAEKSKLIEVNQKLETELQDVVADTDEIVENIKYNEDQVVSLTKDVTKVQKNAGDIQSTLLSGEHYESKMKELKQLQTKKTILAKKLKSSKKIIQRNDFTNFKDALQMYQDDINTLEVNNMVIEKQIELVTQQVSRCYNYSDQQKLKELYSSKDNEIQILLQKIRDAQRKDPSDLEHKEEDQGKNEQKQQPSNSTLNIHHLIQKQSLLFDISEEFGSLEAQIASINESIERLLNDRENPEMDLNKIKEIECLKSEADTIAATIQSEMKNAKDNVKVEEQVELEINRIDAMLVSRKEELDSINSEKETVVNEIDEMVKKRGEMRKNVDSLLEDENEDVQKLVGKVQSFSRKCEESADKLRNDESELSIKKSKFIEMKSSKDIAKYNDLLTRKTQIENEIPQLKASFKQSTETNAEYDQKINDLKQLKLALLEKYKKYEKSYKIDKEELDKLESYANMLLTLINSNRNRRK